MNRINLRNLAKNFEKTISLTNSNKTSRNLAQKIKKELQKKNNNYLIIDLNEKDQDKIQKKTIKVSKLFGNQIGQDKNKKKIVLVTPNLKILKKNKNSLDKNVRYHQTNSGGSIHTDGPQLSKTPKILIMSCVNNAKKGGDTILVDANKIHSVIKKNKPEYLKILSKSFYFERRGFDYSKNYLKRPILKKIKNKINLRYLREYIITGFQKANKQIFNDQIQAMEYLDKILNNNKNQKKVKMKNGQLIIINNKNTAHGRTNFIINKNSPRKFLRIWTN